MNTPAAFWDRVALLIKERGSTLKAICYNNAIPYDTIISNKVRGRYPSLENALAIAGALYVPMEYLYSGSKKKAPLTTALAEDGELQNLVKKWINCSREQKTIIAQLLDSWG